MKFYIQKHSDQIKYAVLIDKNFRLGAWTKILVYCSSIAYNLRQQTFKAAQVRVALSYLDVYPATEKFINNLLDVPWMTLKTSLML